MHFITDFLIRSMIRTRLFNDYNGAESHNPPKTHETPPQNCSAAGLRYRLELPKSLISSGFQA